MENTMLTINPLAAAAFLEKNGDDLMLALSLARCASQRDVDNLKTPGFIRKTARKDVANWDRLQTLLAPVYDPQGEALRQAHHAQFAREKLNRIADAYCSDVADS